MEGVLSCWHLVAWRMEKWKAFGRVDAWLLRAYETMEGVWSCGRSRMCGNEKLQLRYNLEKFWLILGSLVVTVAFAEVNLVYEISRTGRAPPRTVPNDFPGIVYAGIVYDHLVTCVMRIRPSLYEWDYLRR